MQLASPGSYFSDTDLFTLIKSYMLPNKLYLFPKSPSTFSALEFIIKNFPNPKSEVTTDSLGFAFVKQFVLLAEHRPSWEFIRQKFSG